MKRTAQRIHNINGELKKKQLSLRALSKKTFAHDVRKMFIGAGMTPKGISLPAIYKIANGGEPRETTINKIELAFNLLMGKK
jgi:hypothetical protein